jgi:signal recognition particle receptor subunit beta
MVELLHSERTIRVKIVYYGPPLGGKTTNLQVLHQHAQAQRRGEFVSINSAQDRTILFDLLPLNAPGFRGYDIRIQTVAVPGQAMYAATRRLVLKNADAIVFVANSAADRWEENLQSLQEMTRNLLAHQLDPAALPLVLQYNKRDLPQVTPIEFMEHALNARKTDAIPAVAVRGEGVLETFTAVLVRALQDLSHRYQIVQSSKGQSLPQWAHDAVIGMFGTTSLALEPNPLPAEAAAAPPAATPATDFDFVAPPPPEPPPERLLVKVALPAEAERMAGLGPDARANETLVESYAQASAQLSAALAEAKDERDALRRRGDDLQQVLSAAHGLLAGQPLDPTLRAILARAADAVSARHASFLVRSTDGTWRLAAMRGNLHEDPLLRSETGRRYLAARIQNESEPRLHTVEDALDLGDALDVVEPRFGSVLAVPVRTPRALLGLALLYLAPDAAPPGPQVLAHLSMVSRSLASALELHTTLETVRNAERSLEVAMQGTASVRGLGEVVSFLESLRDEFGAMRRRADIPPWFLGEFTRLAPNLMGALATARAIVAFNRGAVEKEPVAVEDLVAELSGDEVEVRGDVPRVSVLGDRVLLRLALKALVDQARHGAAAVRVPMRISDDSGRLRLIVDEAPSSATLLGAPAEGAPASPTALALGFVRRVIELHDGSLSVEPGDSGNRYVIAVPLA